MLNILSGERTANIKSFPIAKGEMLDQGDWVAFYDGKLKKVAGAFTGESAVFPVYAGNVRFYDTRFLGEADVVTAKSGILETDKMDAVSFNAGDPVFVKDGMLTNKDGAGEGAVAVGFAIEASGIDVKGMNVVKFQLA